MKTFKEHAQDNTASAHTPRLTAEQAEIQQAEEEHWETLLSLLAQTPAAVLPAAAPRERGRSGEVPNTIASKPLLKPEPAAVSIKITRGAAEHYPLPSNVPSARSTKRAVEPAAKPQAAAKPVVTQTVQTEEPDKPAHPAEPRNPVVLPERLTESWSEKLSQRIRATFDMARTPRASSIKPVNKAEVAYDPEGHVDYVTYTINAPVRKSRRTEPLT
jgi:hypothetical protein